MASVEAMETVVRLLDLDSDLEPLAELHSAVHTQPVSSGRLRERLNLPVEVQRSTVAVAPDGAMVGHAVLLRYGSRPPGQFSLSIIVHPDLRRRRIGTRLYGDALRHARNIGMKELEGKVADDDEAGQGFAGSLGFGVVRHRIRSWLDLQTFAEDLFAPTWDRARAADIRLLTLRDVGDTLEARRRVYELNRTISADIPDRGPFFSLDEYLELRFDRSWYHADCLTLALQGEEWVGLNQVNVHRDEGYAFVQMTGVAAGYRGQKIGQALELMGIRCARRYGATTIGTSIDGGNEPMLALSRKLGYRPKGGYYLVRRRFG